MVGVTAGPPVVFLGAARRRSRDAPTDSITLAFQGHYSRFVDMHA
jgi:hypothetical protein